MVLPSLATSLTWAVLRLYIAVLEEPKNPFDQGTETTGKELSWHEKRQQYTEYFTAMANSVI